MSFTAVLPVYLPKASYFIPFLTCKTVLFADHVQFRKRSSIIRNRISQNGPVLSIPVKHNGYAKAIYTKEIAQIENWNLKHLKCIYHTFNTAPYFDDYFPEIESILKMPVSSLSDFLLKLTGHFLDRLKINVTIKKTSELNFKNNLEDELIKFAKKNEHLSTYYYFQKDVDNGSLNIQSLNDESLSTCVFPQLITNDISTLSVLELLFQYGPEAAFLIRDLE
ncbi:MAG: hypothetical protein D8M58_13260 [Calditrichaeota bacterium]|nr:MAG: hypothetical protein DWQ03_14045 [Calditrichota bacterium]MBL1206369.1 hypothetical protein [Calditrichota bacterium]NOG46195.1 hypothetical protein [Calditrichota bacterium]